MWPMNRMLPTAFSILLSTKIVLSTRGSQVQELVLYFILQFWRKHYPIMKLFKYNYEVNCTLSLPRRFHMEALFTISNSMVITMNTWTTRMFCSLDSCICFAAKVISIILLQYRKALWISDRTSFNVRWFTLVRTVFARNLPVADCKW